MPRKAPPPPDVRQIITKRMGSIEDKMVEWSAAGRLLGGVAIKPDPPPPKPVAAEETSGKNLTRPQSAPPAPPKPKPPSYPKLEAALKAAQTDLDRYGLRLHALQAKSARLKQEIEEAATTKKKAPDAKSPEELQQELATCQTALDATKEKVKQKKSVRDEHLGHLEAARAETAAAAKLIETAKYESKLRQLHKIATNRLLPCRLPHLLEAAKLQVSQRPEELLLGCEDMRTLLFSIGLGADQLKGFDKVFKQIAHEDRMSPLVTPTKSAWGVPQPASSPRGYASFGAIKRHLDGHEARLKQAAAERDARIKALYSTPTGKSRPFSAQMARGHGGSPSNRPQRPASAVPQRYMDGGVNSSREWSY